MALRFVDFAQRDIHSVRVGVRIARSRQEIFRELCQVIFHVAPRWGVAGSVLVVTNPLLTRVDVRSVFDEIQEKHHVAGIALHFVERERGLLHVFFECGDAAA